MARGPAMDISSTFDDKGVEQAERAMKGLDRQTAKTDKAVGRMGKNGAKAMKLLKRAAIGASIALAGAAAVGFAKVTQAASDMEESLSKSRATFEESAAAVEKWAGTTTEAFGISKQAALEGAATFGALLKPVGFATDAAAKMGMRYVELAADMASFNNEDPSEMLDRLRAGLAGEAEPLSRFIGKITEAEVKQHAWTEGIARTGEVLTEQEKVQARYELILQRSVDQHGDFERTSGQLANQQRVLQAQIADISATIGKVFIPMVTGAITAINKWTKALKANGLSMDEWAKQGQVSIGGLSRWYDQVLGPTIDSVLDDSRAAWELFGGTVEDVGSVIVKVTKGHMIVVREVVETALAFIRGDFGEMKASVKKIYETMLKDARQVFVRLPQVIATATFDAGKKAGEEFVDAFMDGLSSIGDRVGDALRGMVPGDLGGGLGGGFGLPFAVGGTIPGPRGAGDIVPAMLSPGEFVVRRQAVDAVGVNALRSINARGRRFATGGLVTREAETFARAQVGEPYVWGGGHEFSGPADRRGWDCSGFASQVALRIPGYTGGVGTTMTLRPNSRPATGSEPVVFGFRGIGNGARGEHMGIRVNGVWYDAGSGGVETGDARWDELRVPRGLEYLASGAGPDPSAFGGGSGLGGGGGPSIQQLTKQKSALIKRARALVRGGISLGRTASDIAQESIGARHRDDSLQDKRVTALVEGRLAGMGVTNPEKVRAIAEASVLKTRKREVLADAKDVKQAANRVRRELVKEKKRRKKLYRQLRKTGVRRQDRLRRLYDAITFSRERSRSLIFELRGLIAEAADLQATAAELNFDIGQLAQDIAELPNVATEAAGAEPRTVQDPNQAAATAQATERARVAERASALNSGFLRTIGRTADLAAGGGATTININTLHPGDPALQAELASWIAGALGGQGSIPATSQAVG